MRTAEIVRSLPVNGSQPSGSTTDPGMRDNEHVLDSLNNTIIGSNVIEVLISAGLSEACPEIDE